MATQNGVLGSSIARKIAMALSGFFLMFFLLQHLTINLTSVISADIFNELSHFMGTNPVVQFLLQPVLAFGVFFHLIMGIWLELKNREARPIKYAHSKPETNSSWMSRNMIITGIMVLLFLGLHFYDFWFPELKIKFIDGVWNIEDRYFEELQHKFTDPIRVGLYCLSFVFLGLHLSHGFQSAFQSVGFKNSNYAALLQNLATLYAIVVPFGFIFIALFHFLAH
jgi:succinate dehydrogenase / fumarate reductase cytochrome b subunit